jgi:peptidoglycan hydrolase CwlO-like protein
LSAKNMDLSQIVEEQNDKMESLGLALEDAQNKLTGINGDLSRALADQEERIGKEKEMRRELRKVQAELDHLRKFGDDSTER